MIGHDSVPLEPQLVPGVLAGRKARYPITPYDNNSEDGTLFLRCLATLHSRPRLEVSGAVDDYESESMQPIQIQVIWAHPRRDSLTATIAQQLIDQLAELGAHVDELDLYRSGFDSVLHAPDEPDWENPEKYYSNEVREHAARTMAATAVVFVFPVWWYSLPALLKGYIDRVWNYGLFYGGEHDQGIAAVRWVGLAGHSREKFQKRGYDRMMAHHLNIGIAEYCGVHDSRLELLYNTLGDDISDMPRHIEHLRSMARTSAAELVKHLNHRPRFSEVYSNQAKSGR